MAKPKAKPPAKVSARAKDEQVFALIAQGYTLRQACRELEISPSALIERVRKDESVYEQYTRARDIGYELMADEMLDIAEDGTNDWVKREKGGPQFNQEHVARSKLRIETRKWLLAKALPKRYGERVTHDVEGGMTLTVATGVPRDEPAQVIDGTARKRD